MTNTCTLFAFIVFVSAVVVCIFCRLWFCIMCMFCIVRTVAFLLICFCWLHFCILCVYIVAFLRSLCAETYPLLCSKQTFPRVCVCMYCCILCICLFIFCLFVCVLLHFTLFVIVCTVAFLHLFVNILPVCVCVSLFFCICCVCEKTIFCCVPRQMFPPTPRTCQSVSVFTCVLYVSLRLYLLCVWKSTCPVLCFAPRQMCPPPPQNVTKCVCKYVCLSRLPSLSFLHLLCVWKPVMSFVLCSVPRQMCPPHPRTCHRVSVVMFVFHTSLCLHFCNCCVCGSLSCP